MPIGFQQNVIKRWQTQLAQGHTETWLASFITLWAIAVVIFSWWLVGTHHPSVKWILAGVILYEVLP